MLCQISYAAWLAEPNPIHSKQYKADEQIEHMYIAEVLDVECYLYVVWRLCLLLYPMFVSFNTCHKILPLVSHRYMDLLAVYSHAFVCLVQNQTAASLYM